MIDEAFEQVDLEWKLTERPTADIEAEIEDWDENPPTREFNIAALGRGKREVVRLCLTERPKYPQGLYVDSWSWYGNHYQNPTKMRRNDLKNLLVKVIECLGRVDGEKLYTHAQNPAVENFLNQIGAEKDESKPFVGRRILNTSSRVKDIPLRIANREQLQAALDTL